jgi:putative endonuclease
MLWPASIAAWWQTWRRPKPIGYQGERAAEKFLRGKGYKIVGHHLMLRSGELDLVAIDDRTVVFVEVKTRRSGQFGTPAEAVTIHKQRRLTRIGLEYLKRYGLLEYPCRFDVVGIVWPKSSTIPTTIEHFPNAFEAVGFDGLYS